MTDAFMRQRVMAQLASYPRGQDRTAAEIASGMAGNLAARDIEPTLALFEHSTPQLAVREPDGRRPDRWRLAL